MRHLLCVMALAGLLPAAAAADSQSFTLSSGYNETYLSSDFNRGTALQGQISRGRFLYTGSFDSRGLASVGLGGIAPGAEIDYTINRYPTVTLFASPGEGSGVAFSLIQDWYWRGRPTRTPGKYLTLFQTQAGVVCQDGEQPKVRVTQRFVSSQRRFPGRSQGMELVWEFKSDYPTELVNAGGRGQHHVVSRRSMRYEHWAFFSHELGIGVLTLNVGATHKTVFQQPATGDPASPAASGLDGPTQSRVPVLMMRVSYTIRRW